MSSSSSNKKHPGPLNVSLFAFAWAILGLMISGFYSPADWQATVGVLMISQAFCGALVWSRFRMTVSAVLPDFLTVFLFMQFVSKSLTAMGQVVLSNLDAFGKIGEPLIRLDAVPAEYRFQAELVFLLATCLFTLFWRLLEGKNPLAVWHEPSPKIMWGSYFLGLSVYVALRGEVFGVSFGAIVDLMKLFAIGSLAVLLGGSTSFALGNRRSWLSILALLPLFVLALRTGMKSEIGLVSLPFLLPIFRRINFRGLLLLGGFILFVVLFVFPFSHAWREANWDGEEQVGIQVVASRVFSNWEEVGLLAAAAEGAGRWLARGSSAEQGGLVMMLADRDGLIGPILVEGLSTIFVPRIFWPDKPIYQPGAWFSWYLGFASSPETATTSTAMLLPTELYWMFGIFGVLIGMPLLAMLYFNVWGFLTRRAVFGIVPLVALFALLARSGELETIHTIYAISAPIIIVIYVVIFDFAQRHLFPRMFQSSFRRHGNL